MRCPFCKVDDDKVIDTRVVDAGRTTRRRRVCQNCSKRFTTYEKVESKLNLTLIKRDGSRVPYAREKVADGIRKACYKRAVSEATIERVVDDIEEELMGIAQKEMQAKEIGLMVVERLKQVDHVAFLRYASIYMNPERIDDLLVEILAIKDQPTPEPGKLF